jgi:hypothetical protein
MSEPNESNSDRTLVVERGISRQLAGSKSNFLQTIFFFVLSIVSVGYGIIHYEYDNAGRPMLSVEAESSTNSMAADGAFLKEFMGLAVIFMINSIFNVSKTIRDTQISDLYAAETWTHFTRGTIMSRMQSYLAMALAIYVPYTTILSFSKDEVNWTGELGYLMLSLAYTIQTSMNLAKVIRDISDSHFFEKIIIEQEAIDEASRDKHLLSTLKLNMRKVSAGTAAFFYINCFSAFLSCFSVLSGLYEYQQLSVERKGTIVIGVIFLISMAVQISKLIRDIISPDENVRKSLTNGYILLTVLSTLAALVCSFGAIYFMFIHKGLSFEQFKFLFTGELFILTSVLTLSKLIRDAAERDLFEQKEKES